ncbi:hypothetical protein [Govanella unica]|uniref:Uncharacterized protein n=1 Tax=Govanella unica TaxID=2975056 RepID=A0A9X3TWC1_9PROT|nr:hypothetical protein [Govania unica]MDA5192925.1 hypothetical protein [Govania unica]
MDKLDAVKRTIATPPGPRPQFFSDPAIDQLLDITVAMAGEMAVLYERLDSLERLIEKAGLADRATIEGYQPDPATLAERMKWNEAFVMRVFNAAAAGASGRAPGQTE